MGFDLMETEFCTGSTRVMSMELDLGFHAKKKKSYLWTRACAKINIQGLTRAEILPARYVSVTARGAVILDIVCVSL